ncbi:MAG: hypothetical protein LBV53_02495 [Mycoplasmataceae bacterium]|jgi:hypothetical protein|nr:hypothetical protein [Mycoplasmataceae bacterium]
MTKLSRIPITTLIKQINQQPLMHRKHYMSSTFINDFKIELPKEDIGNFYYLCTTKDNKKIHAYGELYIRFNECKYRNETYYFIYKDFFVDSESPFNQNKIVKFHLSKLAKYNILAICSLLVKCSIFKFNPKPKNLMYRKAIRKQYEQLQYLFEQTKDKTITKFLEKSLNYNKIKSIYDICKEI